MVAHSRVLIAVASTAAIIMLSVPITASSARFVWNLTPSAPKGLYRIERDGWYAGDRVAVRPSRELALLLEELGVLKRGRLLIKTISAVEGDHVCRAGEEVTINGKLAAIARATTPAGEGLPFWEGCHTLTADDVFLLGETDESFDGRYFGVTSARDIVGQVRLLVRAG